MASSLDSGCTSRRRACDSVRGRRAAPLALALLLALCLAALAAAAPAAAAEPQGPPQGLLALLAVQQAQLLAGDGAAGDFFGHSVALSGDTALVGAPLDDVSDQDEQGSAYVYVRTGATWTFQQQLTADDGAGGDNFGWCVAISGDTAVVGAFYDDIGGNADQGSAYVFVRAGTAWTFQQKLTADDGAAGDTFGISVAIAGDTALIGSDSDEVGGNTHQGSAYVFVRSGGAWGQQAKLVAGDGAPEDFFGVSVALSGDTALIGSYADDVGSTHDQGSAYVFVRSGTMWSQQARLSPADGTASEGSGYSVALSGDTALVGCVYDTVGGNGSQGSAYVFVRSGTTWSQLQKLTADDGAADDLFARGVALSGDTALVASYGDDVGTTADQGPAYVFVRSGTTWSQEQKLVASDGAASDHFAAVALSGATALVGAFNDDVGGNADQGSAYVFLLDGTPPTTTAGTAPPANSAGWSRTPVTVTLSATDALSGVASTQYRRSSASSWTTYRASFRVSAQGVSRYQVRSTDKAGNVEPAKTVTVRIDGRRPTTSAYAATVKKGTRVTLAFKVNDPRPGCGRATVVLRVYRGGKLKATLKAGSRVTNLKAGYRWRCTQARGLYTIKVYATDIAGNRQVRVGSARLTVK